MRHLLLSLFLLAAVSASSCNILYVQDIEQGNILTQEMIDQVRPGMTRRQVTFILGTPLVADPFHANRWDYYYELIPGDKKAGKKKLITIFFKGDGVSQIVRDMPYAKPASDTNSPG